ncbi:hypothetical protein F511_16230 [Dorcoceras hygrometricum]|uniref:Uncharacterized protein n=1 Tax=Dorcoceras hygrometricum TaxID=472368 RepID=A0A2Z7DF65_9LAMI|nr:hypothetical protein F511_16230 [Dorcoceras hygrometricum]
MMGKFEVVLPHPDERAHRAPPGFHTFYVNQLDMGLRFPIPRFLTSLCKHIKISPSQLAPNSYSFLLALAVLLSYHDIPLIPYVFMQLAQIKRLGPGKFYISHKGDHTFIKGNASSHKRDNVYTLAPQTPDRSPNLISFLEAMRGKSYNAPELIKEDLLCFFGFSRKGVNLVGDLVERMGKADMLAVWDKVVGASSEATAPPAQVAKKRKASAPADKEVRRQNKRKGASNSEARGASTTLGRIGGKAPNPRSARGERPPPPFCRGDGKPCRADGAARGVEGYQGPGEECGGGSARGAEGSAGETAAEAELEEDKAWAEEEIGHLRTEAANAWDVGKEDFLKSSEFDKLCAKKSVRFFRAGFESCVAQLRANGYSEEEHPVSFLSVRKGLEELPDDEAEAEEEEEGEVSGDESTPPSPPK